MRIITVFAVVCCICNLLILPCLASAQNFNWVDKGGFHSVDSITQVPMEQRMELPIVKNSTSLPYTEDEDRDGAMFVWFALNQAGADYRYVKAKDIPTNRQFVKVSSPVNGDVGWWRGYVAISQNGGKAIMTSKTRLSLASVEKKRGPVVWYRFSGKKRIIQRSAARATAAVLKELDSFFAGIDQAAEYPLKIDDPQILEKLKLNWEKAKHSFEAARAKYPDDPQVLKRLGVLYRRGHNLDFPGSWERSEAFLLRTETLAPSMTAAYISLGILYGDLGKKHWPASESQFKKALRHAGKNEQPHIWWGLANVLANRGKKSEALKYVEKLQRLKPADERIKKLHSSILEMKSSGLSD